MRLHSIAPEILLLLLQQLAANQGWEEIAVTDEVALDEALGYPLLQAALLRTDVADIAAAHALGILRHRPFCARNEQAALLAMGLFLYFNSWHLHASQEEIARLIWQASAADLDEHAVAHWLRQRL